jgi:hypothetical protein
LHKILFKENATQKQKNYSMEDIMKFKSSIFLVLTSILVLGTIFVGNTVNANDYTREEIREKWLEFKPSYTGTPYLSVPDTKEFTSSGQINNDFLIDGLKAVNWYRYLAKIPYDVELSDEYNLATQKGAVLLAAMDKLSHSPSPKPEGMSEEFYNTGVDATKTSNIFYYSKVIGLESTVDSYMKDDSNESNMATLGHRRWIINPSMKKPGLDLLKQMVKLVMHILL